MTLPARSILPNFKSKVKLPSGHRFFKDCLRESFARWISWATSVFPSENVWFVTVTFKREVTYTKALRMSHYWLGRLIQAYLYKTGYRIRWIRTLAFQKRGVIHFHLLVCGQDLGLLSRKRWEHRWQTIDWNAGTCRIYESDADKPRYLAREITKEGDISWGGNWQGLRTPGAVRCCDSHAQH